MSKTGLIRGLLATCVLSLAACSNAPAEGALHVIVKLEPGAISQCVIVTASDGSKHDETAKMPVDGQSQLDVAIRPNGMATTITVQAIGYVDAACTTEALGETSEATAAHFGSPPNTVTLIIAPAHTDGGTDAGSDGGTDGGTDGGSDGGIDADHDGWNQGEDCDDGNALVHPGMTESCTNRIDDDCDLLTDCEDQMACMGRSCANGGTCMGTTCVTPTESICDDRADNDGDLLIDCADPDCVAGTTCSDGDGCTTGDRCVSDAGCESTGSVMCMTPPNLQCWATGGTCERDAGATCRYTQLTGGCDDGNACTTGETCANGSCGGGTTTTCGQPPVCRGAGTCQPADGGCFFPPVAQGTGSCDDGNNCTLGDTCDGDGGCSPGTPVMCTAPTQCHQVNTSVCEADGGCTYLPRTGQTCDAGMGVTGSCSSSFTCVPQGVLFPFTPSNFTESNLPDAGANFNITNCDATLDTSGPSINCGLTLPAFTLVNQPLGGQAVLFRVSDFSISTGRSLTIIGTRPAIIAATGNINIPFGATLRARNAAGTSAECGNGGDGNGNGSGNGNGGGGGGGFGSAGGLGGTSGGGGAGTVGAANGNNALTPLRGGCNGGAGGATAGGAGGGAVQLVSANALAIGGLISAPGLGGGGAQADGEGGGGGGSGGGILLETQTLALSGTVTANGGGGGEGSGMSNGNAGAEGTNLLTGALGGIGGSGAGGNGGFGGAALTTAGNGETVGNNVGGGGGGGGVGRIRIRVNSACSLTGITSPTPNTTGC